MSMFSLVFVYCALPMETASMNNCFVIHLKSYGNVVEVNGTKIHTVSNGNGSPINHTENMSKYIKYEKGKPGLSFCLFTNFLCTFQYFVLAFFLPSIQAFTLKTNI